MSDNISFAYITNWIKSAATFKCPNPSLSVSLYLSLSMCVCVLQFFRVIEWTVNQRHCVRSLTALIAADTPWWLNFSSSVTQREAFSDIRMWVCNCHRLHTIMCRCLSRCHTCSWIDTKDWANVIRNASQVCCGQTNQEVRQVWQLQTHQCIIVWKGQLETFYL